MPADMTLAEMMTELYDVYLEMYDGDEDLAATATAAAINSYLDEDEDNLLAA